MCERYYGVSYPTPDFSTENLRFLTSRQALADIVAVRNALFAEYSLAPTTPALTFGGSYPVRALCA